MAHDLQSISAWVVPFLSQYPVKLVLGDVVLAAGLYLGHRLYTRREE